MSESLFRVVELIFTAYAVPALLVPLLWLLGGLLRRWRRPSTAAANYRELHRLTGLHFALLVIWLLVWGAIWLGLPIAEAGAPAALLCWAAYALANLVLARLLMRFAAVYGSLAPGAASDRLFMRLLGAVIAQPVLTALAFSVLFRVTGVVWQLDIPGTPAVQEGI